MAHFYISCVDESAVIKNNSRINLRTRSDERTYITIERNINYSVRTGGLMYSKKLFCARSFRHLR